MNPKNCTKCGAEIYGELPGGMCPTCLMSVARQSLKDRATAAPSEGFDLPSIGEIATAFPELEILEFVGRGGMGAVYKARQKSLDRLVALKIFLYRPHDPEFAARFEREARALGRLNHPNVVTVYDFGSRGNLHFLTMEFVEGLNLRQLTVEEKLAPEMAIQLVPQLCDALQYAHDQGVVHRDIKPENLLIDTEGRVKIADFGLAKMTNAVNATLTRTQQVMGTLNYMAPEQRETPTQVDHRADIYSLGVVIYELLTGELPFGRFQPPSAKAGVDAKLDEVVLRALEKEPDRRYQQASEFKTGFQNVRVTPPPKVEPPRRQAVPAMPPVKSGTPGMAPQGTRCIITIMSGRDKKGDWTPGNPQLAFTMMGGTELDLSQVSAKHVDITCFTLMGGTEIIVPLGAHVDLDGFILMGATENKVNFASEPDGMRVRIRSWGAMGGCEVRSIKPTERRAQEIIQQRLRGEKTHADGSLIGKSLGFLYYLLCIGVTFSVPLFFIAHGLGIELFPALGLESNLLGIMAAMFTGFLWSCYHYIRVIVGAGPEEDEDPAVVAEHYSKTRGGMLLRCIGMAFVFVCPAIFVINSFDVGNDKIMKFSAIAMAIIGVMFFTAAGRYDDLVFGKEYRQKKPIR